MKRGGRNFSGLRAHWPEGKGSPTLEGNPGLDRSRMNGPRWEICGIDALTGGRSPGREKIRCVLQTTGLQGQDPRRVRAWPCLRFSGRAPTLKTRWAVTAFRLVENADCGRFETLFGRGAEAAAGAALGFSSQKGRSFGFAGDEPRPGWIHRCGRDVQDHIRPEGNGPAAFAGATHGHA